MKKVLSLVIPLFVLTLLHAPAQASRPSVLVINSYHATYPWVQSHNAALKRDLEERADLHFFYMDTKRLPIKLHPVMADQAMQYYEETKPDLVVLTDDNALKMLGRRITTLGTPVVYLGINDNPRSYFGGAIRATGVLERPLLKRSIVFIKELLRGNLDKCLVLFDSGSTARAILNTVFKGEDSLDFAQMSVDLQLTTTFYQWKTHVLASKEDGYQAIILGLYQTIVDEEGHHVSDEEVARWTSQNSPVPVFAFWDFTVGKDMAIGGLVLAGEPQGREAAKLVNRILDGASPLAVQPVTAEHGRFVFSRSELKRWGLALPDDFVHPHEELIFLD